MTAEQAGHRWEFFVAVLVIAILVSIIIAIMAKYQVFRRFLASYRHTRLREADAVSHCDPSGLLFKNSALEMLAYLPLHSIVETVAIL